MTREEKIREYRLKQSRQELERKQKKAWRKSIWTQEDMDLAEAEAHELWLWLNAA